LIILMTVQICPKCKSVTIFVMFFVGRLILRELHFMYKNKLCMFLIVKAFTTAWHSLILQYSSSKKENFNFWHVHTLRSVFVNSPPSCTWSVTLAKSIVPRKTWRKLWHSYISKLFLTKMQVKFSLFFHHGSLNVEMGFCKESMSVPFSSFPWILASPESGQRIVYFD
jgi:hypothetical protein